MLKSQNNFELSPYTGWSLHHWEEIHQKLLQGVKKFASPGNAFIKFPGKTSSNGELSDWIEGYARSSFMSGPFLYQREHAIVDLFGESFDVAEFYARGLINGTDPNGTEYWGEMVDYDQKIVEGAAIALFLYFSKKFVWSTLHKSEKNNVSNWLRQAIGKKVYPNNWMLFNVIINSVLKDLGEDYSQQEIDFYLFDMDKYYVGDGWYRDGVHDVYDYYVAWAIYFYYLLWIKIDGRSHPELSEKITVRAKTFINSYKYLFAGHGGYPAYGRSLTYRFAAVSIFPLMELLEIAVLPPGQARRICSGNVAYFYHRGMMAEENYLTLGYHSAYQPLIEPYSGPGSPYWAAKAFLAFLLPKDHAFWTAVEEPLEIEKGSYSIAVPSAGMMIQGDQKSGLVSLYNQKSFKQFPKKYGNFCYSSHFGFEPKEMAGEFNHDNAISLSTAHKGKSQRAEIHHLVTTEQYSSSYHHPFKMNDGKEDKGTTIYSSIVLKDIFHLRFHYIKSDRKVSITEGGMPLGFENNDLDIMSGEDWDYCCSNYGCSYIQSLSGYDSIVPARGFNGETKGNHIFWNNSVVPAMKRQNGFNHEIVTGVLVYANTLRAEPDDLRALLKNIKIENNIILITFYDDEKIFLQTHDLQKITVTLNKTLLSGLIHFTRVDKEGTVLQLIQ